MAKVEGVTAVVAELGKRRKESEAEGSPSVIVGYTTAYAIFVHENLEAKHPIGQAKFLEEPARTMQPELAGIIRGAMQRGATLTQALLMAGLRLQRESQLRVPVDTGTLKNSAFTELENG